MNDDEILELEEIKRITSEELVLRAKEQGKAFALIFLFGLIMGFVLGLLCAFLISHFQTEKAMQLQPSIEELINSVEFVKGDVNKLRKPLKEAYEKVGTIRDVAEDTIWLVRDEVRNHNKAFH